MSSAPLLLFLPALLEKLGECSRDSQQLQPWVILIWAKVCPYMKQVNNCDRPPALLEVSQLRRELCLSLQQPSGQHSSGELWLLLPVMNYRTLDVATCVSYRFWACCQRIAAQRWHALAGEAHQSP